MTINDPDAHETTLAAPFSAKDLHIISVLSTAAAQYEDLQECLASFCDSSAKTNQLHTACMDAVSVFQSQQSHSMPDANKYMHAATAVAQAVLDSFESVNDCCMSRARIQGKGVPADVREETNQFILDLYKSAPGDFWESMMYDIEAIKATASVVLANCASNNVSEHVPLV